jgi:uncharacterized membrane protein YtjA (UPF0391 family)
MQLLMLLGLEEVPSFATSNLLIGLPGLATSYTNGSQILMVVPLILFVDSFGTSRMLGWLFVTRTI